MGKAAKWLGITVGLLLALLVGALSFASLDRCGTWQAHPPEVVKHLHLQGAFSAGASRVELLPPYPVVAAGYGLPWRHTSSSARPLYARSLVFETHGVKFALVEADVLLMPEAVVDEIRRQVADLKFVDVWVIATHTHSSFGGYDDRLFSELAGTGHFRPDVRRVLIETCAKALRQAAAGLEPVSMELGERAFPNLVAARGDSSDADARLTRMVLRDKKENVLAELTIFAAHPTLARRGGRQLSPDYPGTFSAQRENAQGGVSLLLQGAVGNATAVGVSVNEFASAVAQAARQTPTERMDPSGLSLAEVRVSLPHPDGRRLSRVARPALENLLCQATSRSAELGVLDIGPLRLIAVPGEATLDSARAMERIANGTRTLSLANGYLGYIETAQAVRDRKGESRKQYFRPELLDRFVQGVRAGVASLQQPPR